MSEPNDIHRHTGEPETNAPGNDPPVSGEPGTPHHESAGSLGGAPEFPPPPSDVAPLSHPPPSVGARPSRFSQPVTGPRPTFLFFGIVAAVSLVADVFSKAWAEIELSRRTILEPSIILIPDHLTFTLAYNKGGAWGLLAGADENIRRPFFLLVSALAIGFIVSLYGRLAPNQRALKWGLPLVLGGALGNLSDRIIRSGVIDFIDYRANWIESMNRTIAKVVRTWGVTDHWPTFNVADISICIGVGLMAVDMFMSKRGHAHRVSAPPPAAAPKPPLPEEPLLAAPTKPSDPPPN